MNTVLVSNNYIMVPGGSQKNEYNVSSIGTVLSQMARYGFAPSIDVINAIVALTPLELSIWWANTEVVLREVSGSSRNMDRFVVYKNFPREVLKMSEAQYWCSQICMYIGVPNEFFVEDEETRKPLNENLKLKVLALANEHTAEKLYSDLVALPNRWSDPQRDHVRVLFDALRPSMVDVSSFGFKENGIFVASIAMKNKNAVNITTTTDVIRLAAGMSGADISLRTRVKFCNFSRYERKTLLSLINNQTNILDDFLMRPEISKRLLSRLHPGDYPEFSNVISAYDKLYRKDGNTFNSIVENGIRTQNSDVLDVLAARPGDFIRRFHKLYQVFGSRATDAIVGVFPNLTINQIAKFVKYVETINNRKTLMHPPRGNWEVVKIVDNKKVVIDASDIKKIQDAANSVMNQKLYHNFPEGFTVGEHLDRIKLQTNDQKLAAYGRGTRFPIPENITFLRSASYWAIPSHSNIWFDNGWIFLDNNMKSVNACCWNRPNIGYAVFSGDPTNSKDMKGRACQMIDLYLDKMKAKGIRYAIWNILCYSGIPFDDADDVFATLQMGENPESGKLYEPARAQMAFPLKGANKTKYIAYIDVETRELVYLDANLFGVVSSAIQNCKIMETQFPAFIEYMNSLPSVNDVLGSASYGSIPAFYDDDGITIKSEKAFVFKPTNAANTFARIELSNIVRDDR